jgi:hypothetical protein
MAEKKFFVDINLQGSALTNAKIGTNSGIGSTEGAFGYDSSAHRLQYFDGTATKEVANLSDIAAVTGGLIFQGGYDPTTDTPDITNGDAYKGFFWAATAAGTFLGESVQVGDSIVAKVDGAGATAADWLILQGNIVIATDTVDGISRLATQTEANDGTEGGAVVITPATLQGKIDAQITPEINDKLSKTGGTMSGAINMGSYPINNIETPSFDADAANKFYVDNQLATALPLAGGTMSGNIDLGFNQITNIDSTNADYTFTNYLGNSTNEGDVIKLNSSLDAQGQKSITNLPAPTDGGDATNKTYVDDADALKLDLAGGTMSGNIDMGNSDINNVTSIYAHGIATNGLEAKDGTTILVYSDADFQDSTITGVRTPTADSDAANKTYVDTTASTAQANANAYTDSKFFSSGYADTDWVLDAGVYHLNVYHAVNTPTPQVSVYSSTGEPLEFYVLRFDSNSIDLQSNIAPPSLIEVGVSK